MLARQLKFEKGSLKLFDERIFIVPGDMLVILQKTANDEEAMAKHLYQTGIRVNQTYFSAKLFGFTKDKPHEFAKLMTDIADATGWGIYNFIDLDFKKKQAIVNTDNTLVGKIYGYSKVPVDHLMRGFIVGSARLLFNDPTIEGIETTCIAKGDKTCTFVLKKRNEFDINSKLFKSQIGD